MNISFNHFTTIHDNCSLLSLPLMYFGGLYCKDCGPRSEDGGILSGCTVLIKTKHSPGTEIYYLIEMLINRLIPKSAIPYLLYQDVWDNPSE